MNSIISKHVDDFLDGSVTVLTIFQNAAIPDFLVPAHMAGIQKIGPAYYNELKFQKDYQIQYTIRGKGRALINGIAYTAEEGDVIAISNYMHHTFSPIQGEEWEIAFVHINEGRITSEIFEYLNTCSGYILHNVPKEPILHNIKKIISFLQKNNEEPDFDNITMISSCTYQLFMTLVQLSASHMAHTPNAYLYNVIQYIRANYHRPIRMNDILSQSSYSKTHLERLFKKEMGMSVYQYLSQLRLRRAQELISTGQFSYKEVASLVGLSSYRGLHYLFKNSIHMSPSEYESIIKEKVATPRKSVSASTYTGT